MIRTRLNVSSSNPTLDFVAAPALAPAEVEVDPALMEQYRQEMAQVSASCLGPAFDPHSLPFVG